MDKEENNIRKELQLVSASKSYAALKLIALVSIVCMAIITTSVFLFYDQKVEDLSNRVIVMDTNGLAGSGQVKTMADKDIVRIQVKAAIKYAVPCLYSFNSANFDEQIEKGLKLFGNSGKEIHTEYINGNVREKVFNSNLEVSCEIKDGNIQILEDKDGLHAAVVFSQTFTNGDVSNERELTVKMDILRTKISETNPFGYLIENWVIVSENRK